MNKTLMIAALCAFALTAACGQPPCNEGSLRGPDGNCYVQDEREVHHCPDGVLATDAESCENHQLEPEVIETCRCNGEEVACDADCAPQVVTETECECNGEPMASCDDICEPEVVTEYVCEADGSTVDDPAACPSEPVEDIVLYYDHEGGDFDQTVPPNTQTVRVGEWSFFTGVFPDGYPGNSGEGSPDVLINEVTITGSIWNDAGDTGVIGPHPIGERIDQCYLTETATGEVLAEQVFNPTNYAFVFEDLATMDGDLSVTMWCDFADIEPIDNNDDVYRFIIMYDSSVKAEGLDGEEVISVGINHAIEHVTAITVSTSVGFDMISVNVSAPPAHQTVVAGSQNVPMVGNTFHMDDDRVLATAEYLCSGTSDPNATDTSAVNLNVNDRIASCRLRDADTGALLDGPKVGFVTGNAKSIVFTDVAMTLPADDMKKTVLECSVTNLETDAAVAGGDLYSCQLSRAVLENTQGEAVFVGYPMQHFESSNDYGDVASVTVVDRGSMDIGLDGSSPNNDIILGDSSGVAMSTFSFEADVEPFAIQTLTLKNCDACADDITLNVKVAYENEAGDMVTKTGFLSGGSVTFQALDFYVPDDDDIVLDVMIDTNSVGSGGATSGHQIQLDLDLASPDAFTAVGQTSGETLTEEDLGVLVSANPMTIRKTKPTITLNAGSPSGAAVPGFQEVLRFDVAADSRGFVGLDFIMFELSSTDNADTGWNTCENLADPAKWALVDAADPSVALDEDIDWVFLGPDDTGNCTGTSDVRYVGLWLAHPQSDEGGVEIGAGETRTFSLSLDTNGADASLDDSVRVDIPDQQELNALSPSWSSLMWQDDIEAEVDNGSLVDNLPVTGGTLVF